MKTFKNYLEVIQEMEKRDELLPEGLTIINRTPHDVIANGITYPKTDKVTRVDTVDIATGNKLFVNQEYGDIIDLDPKEDKTLYIVSAIVLSAIDKNPKYQKRMDLIAPNTGKTATRNDKGQITSVPNFICRWENISEVM